MQCGPETSITSSFYHLITPTFHTMQLPTPGFLFTAFLQVCRRFPGPLLCAVLGSIACFALIEENGDQDDTAFFLRNWITCMLGLPFLTALVSYAESKAWEEKRSWMLQLIGLALLVGCWFWLDPKADGFEYRTLPRYIVLVLSAHLGVAVGPYLNKRPVREFWEYNRQLFGNLVVGVAFTLILFAGLSLAIMAIDNLFNADIPYRVYPKLFVVLAGVFNTIYFLFHFPQLAPGTASGDGPGDAYNWVFRSLCKYILIPIVLLYFFILYAYGAKIGLSWSLPKGWVSSLVLGFSVAGIFTYLLNFYLAEEDNSLIVKGFKRWFWWVVLPLTALLFVAIGKRISDYGVTEERFVVAQLGVWLAVACLYFLFSKNDNIKFIPISLALFALVGAFGPLSAFSVSERSQKGILISILERNGRFENGKMKPGTTPLTEPERNQVSSSLNFLEYRQAINDLMPILTDSTRLQSGGFLYWLNIDSGDENLTKTLDISAEETYEPFDIRGFDLAYKVELYTAYEQTERDHRNFFTLSKDGKMIEWKKEKEGKLVVFEQFSLTPAIQKWWEKQNKTEAYSTVSLPLSQRTLTFTGRKGTLRVIAESADLISEREEIQLRSLNGWVLLKER